ncbi:hypothetical protein OFC18_33105, partial [Escherichia coli]|nr:hypothetical protein [Escherichia coli]
FLNSEILPFQPSDRDSHPASLIPVIMDAGNLSRLPADCHRFKSFVLVNEISRVKSVTPKKIR